MKVLFLTTVLPHKKQIGSEVASQSIIDGLRRAGVCVHTVGYMRAGDVSSPGDDTFVAGTRYIETRQAKLYPFLWFTLSILKRLPYSAAKYHSRTYVDHVRRLLSDVRYDAVVIDHPQLGWLHRLIPEETKVIFIAHNVEHQMYEEISRTAINVLYRPVYLREVRKIREMETELADRAAEIWAFTENDASYFRTAASTARVRVIPLPATSTTMSGHGECKRFDIGLIGSWAWQANKEGLQWFIDKVYPRLPADMSIRIAGKGASRLIPPLPNVDYVGFVPDALAFMRQARVVAIPTLSGGGIQIKTLDAIGSGSFIVATKRAMRGIDQVPATVATADEPAEFAQKLAHAQWRTDFDTASANAFEWSADRRQMFHDEMVRVAAVLRPISLYTSPHP